MTKKGLQGVNAPVENVIVHAKGSTSTQKEGAKARKRTSGTQ